MADFKFSERILDRLLETLDGYITDYETIVILTPEQKKYLRKRALKDKSLYRLYTEEGYDALDSIMGFLTTNSSYYGMDIGDLIIMLENKTHQECFEDLYEHYVDLLIKIHKETDWSDWDDVGLATAKYEALEGFISLFDVYEGDGNSYGAEKYTKVTFPMLIKGLYKEGNCSEEIYTKYCKTLKV